MTKTVEDSVVVQYIERRPGRPWDEGMLIGSAEVSAQDFEEKFPLRVGDEIGLCPQMARVVAVEEDGRTYVVEPLDEGEGK